MEKRNCKDRGKERMEERRNGGKVKVNKGKGLEGRKYMKRKGMAWRERG